MLSKRHATALDGVVIEVVYRGQESNVESRLPGLQSFRSVVRIVYRRRFL
jgi:hypothetical protein